jgi:hypothetical protein
MTDAYDDMNDSLSGEISGGKSFTFSNAIFGKYFPILAGFIILVFIIVLYAKSRDPGGF